MLTGQEELVPVSNGEETEITRLKRSSIQYGGISKRVKDLAAKHATNFGRKAEVVYMSDHYYDPVSQIVKMEKNQLTELLEGASLTERMEGLIIVRVMTEDKFLQVGSLFDVHLQKSALGNSVPSSV